MSALARFLVTFKAHDNGKSTCYVVAHSIDDANREAIANPNAKEIIKIELIEESQTKALRLKSGWVSNCLSDNLNSQLTDELGRLHK
jgi:hypothetical protein